MKKPERVGPYHLLTPLGDSGRSNVWLASAGVGGEKVALKLAREGDIAGRERLMHECSMAMAFDHPNIVRMHECGEANGVTWISMGYVAGAHGVLTLANVRQLLLAMVHVHANGVIHADIRSGNCLVDESGHLRLAGFALARRLDDPANMAHGAPQPDASGATARQPSDIRADIFAAGMVLYQVLTGKAPSAGAASEDRRERDIGSDSELAPSIVAPGLGDSFDELVHRATASDKAQRYASAFEFLSHFDAACRRGVRASS